MNKFLLIGLGGLLLVAACSSTAQSTDGGACGQAPLGGTCKKPSGECEEQICVGTAWKCPDGDTEVALTPANCAAADGGACGEHPPLGGTCKKPSGECEELICVGTTWKCPDGDTEVALTPANCAAADGGACGEHPPVGGTCKKPGGACEGLICVGTTWKCPDGDTPVAVAPGNCGAADAGTD
jgi:hypothetical protein